MSIPDWLLWFSTIVAIVSVLAMCKVAWRSFEKGGATKSSCEARDGSVDGIPTGIVVNDWTDCLTEKERTRLGLDRLAKDLRQHSMKDIDSIE